MRIGVVPTGFVSSFIFRRFLACSTLTSLTHGLRRGCIPRFAAWPMVYSTISNQTTQPVKERAEAGPPRESSKVYLCAEVTRSFFNTFTSTRVGVARSSPFTPAFPMLIA